MSPVLIAGREYDVAPLRDAQMMFHINKTLKKPLPKAARMRQGEMLLAQLGDGDVWPASLIFLLSLIPEQRICRGSLLPGWQKKACPSFWLSKSCKPSKHLWAWKDLRVHSGLLLMWHLLACALKALYNEAAGIKATLNTGMVRCTKRVNRRNTLFGWCIPLLSSQPQSSQLAISEHKPWFNRMLNGLCWSKGPSVQYALESIKSFSWQADPALHRLAVTLQEGFC